MTKTVVKKTSSPTARLQLQLVPQRQSAAWQRQMRAALGESLKHNNGRLTPQTLAVFITTLLRGFIATADKNALLQGQQSLCSSGAVDATG